MSVFGQNIMLQLARKTSCLQTLNTPELTVFGIINVRFRKRRDIRRRAPSKIYYVREPTPIDPEEHLILQEKYRHYNTTVKSINAFLRSMKSPISQMYQNRSTIKLSQDADIERAFSLNSEWNKKIAEERAVRLAEQAEVLQEKHETMEAQKLELLEREQRKAREMIDRKSLRVANALDVDNLDVALDDFLEREPVNHNFAIDKDGKVKI